MTGRENVKTALRALTANFLRSALAVLGIVIGVGAVTVLAALETGAQREAERRTQALGARFLIVAPQAGGPAGDSDARSARVRLTSADADMLAALPLITAAAPVVQGSGPVVRDNRSARAAIVGTTPGYFVVRDWKLATGRMFSAREQKEAAKVAILGQEAARQLFGPQDPIGQQIRIRSVRFKVIAVLEEKGTGESVIPLDLSVFVPLTTARSRRIGTANAVSGEMVDFLVVKTSPGSAAAAAQQIRTGLRRSHRIPAGQPDGFSLSDPAAALSAEHAVSRTAGWVLAGIAFVSLLTGGISLANIMLLSAAERSREIGLRIAIGARPAHLRNQFLTEAVMLCLAGGAAGLAAGAAAAIAAGRLAGWPVQLDLTAAAGTLLLSGLAGLIFGYGPARRASKTDAGLALRAQ